MGQWTTFSHDPQRSGYAADEHAFSPAAAASLGLEWKTVVPGEPLFLNGLTAPLVVRGVKTAAGPKNLVIVAATSDHLFALNAETGDLVWQADFPGKQPHPEGEWLCPTRLNATPVIDAAHARVFVISSEGLLHTLTLSEGKPAMPPAQFVPSFSKMWSLNYVDGVLYASLSQDCNHANKCAEGPYCMNFFLHKFRHTFATNHLRDGVDIRTVQSWLGHRDIKSRMVYLKGIRSKDAAQKVNSGELAALVA
jgi:hypothetical protein